MVGKKDDGAGLFAQPLSEKERETALAAAMEATNLEQDEVTEETS